MRARRSPTIVYGSPTYASFPSAAVVRTIFWWISSAASGEPSPSHVFSWKKCSAPVAGNGASMR